MYYRDEDAECRHRMSNGYFGMHTVWSLMASICYVSVLDTPGLQ